MRFRREHLPPARHFYERELGQLRQPSRNWARPKDGCPFHESRSKSSFVVNLDSGGFFCFGCGAKGGDVIDFLRLRDGLTFKEAAIRLGCWVDDIEARKRICLQEQERKQQQVAESDRRERQHQKLIAGRDWLHATAELFEEGRRDHDIGLMAELLEPLRQAEDHYCQLAGLELPYGEQ